VDNEGVEVNNVRDAFQRDSETLPEQPPADGIEFVETYETDQGVVFYDVDNPLAWLESSVALSLDEQL
jgi:hypothetical protein